MDESIGVAKQTGAQAIHPHHPRYGLLSENAEFVNKCMEEQSEDTTNLFVEIYIQSFV